MPQQFCNPLWRLLKDCSSSASVYNDDVLINSDNWSEHLAHILSVITAPKEVGLTAKPSLSMGEKNTWST